MQEKARKTIFKKTSTGNGNGDGGQAGNCSSSFVTEVFENEPLHNNDNQFKQVFYVEM